MKSRYTQLVYVLIETTGVIGIIPLIMTIALLSAYITSRTNAGGVENTSLTFRYLYAVNQSSNDRGSISVYDIGAGHRLIKTIQTVPSIRDVRGVVASAVTGKLYVAYRSDAGVGMIYCLNLYTDTVLWNKAIDPGVDRLAISLDGQLLYVPTWEGGSADYINVLESDSGNGVRRVHFSSRSHDASYPLSGPIFQETKASDGSGKLPVLD